MFFDVLFPKEKSVIFEGSYKIVLYQFLLEIPRMKTEKNDDRV
jgi:hypothetical protein